MNKFYGSIFVTKFKNSSTLCAMLESLFKSYGYFTVPLQRYNYKGESYAYLYLENNNLFNMLLEMGNGHGLDQNALDQVMSEFDKNARFEEQKTFELVIPDSLKDEFHNSDWMPGDFKQAFIYLQED